jgi:hypothetical protein
MSYPHNSSNSCETLMCRNNQGVHDHLGEIPNKLCDLADYIHKEILQPVPPPVHLKDRSIGGSSVLSFLEPHRAPDYPTKPPSDTGKANPEDIAIPLTPLPCSPHSPSSLSSTISFLLSHHSDDDCLLESELLESEPSVLRDQARHAKGIIFTYPIPNKPSNRVTVWVYHGWLVSNSLTSMVSMPFPPMFQELSTANGDIAGHAKLTCHLAEGGNDACCKANWFPSSLGPKAQ